MDRGVPILYMQQALRKLSYVYPIKRLIPSGNYDRDTAIAVSDFEKYFNIFPTGQISNELYQKIHLEYINVLNAEKEQQENIDEDINYIMLFQVLNNILAKKYENVGYLTVNGNKDINTEISIKNIQSILNSSIDGILTMQLIMEMIEIL